MAPVELMEPTTLTTQVAHDVQLDELFDADELLIEEISIDGMCGVY